MLRARGSTWTAVRAPEVVLAAMCFAAAALLFAATRHLTFFFDEWDFILNRRGHSVGTFLDPHNGHLSLFGVLAYKVLLALVGLRHYWPHLTLLIALHLLSAVLLYLLVARRLGRWIALGPVALLLFLGTAYQDLLWAFQIGFLASVAGGLGALLLVHRRDRPGRVAAVALLIWSLASSGVGVAFLVAYLVALIARRPSRGELALAAVPVVAFTIWYIGWSSGEHVSSDSILAAPQYVATAAAAAVAGISGLGSGYGPALVVALVAAVAFGLRRAGGTPTPLFLAAVVGVLVFWGLSAVTRADVAEPDASRYVYIGAVFILVAACEAAAVVEWSRPVVGVAAGLIVAAIVANVGALRDGERGMRAADTDVRASLTATEVAAPVVQPTFIPDPTGAPQVPAGVYLSAIRDFGSPAYTVNELLHAPLSEQATADAVLVRAERLAPSSAPAGARAGQCTSAPAGRAVDVDVAPGHRVVVSSQRRSSESLFLRRFAAGFSGAPFARTTTPRTEIAFPRDAQPALTWHLGLTPASPVTVCVS